MADPLRRGYFLAKIFLFGYLEVTMRTRGFLVSDYESLKIHVSEMADTKWRTYFLAKIFFLNIFASICVLRSLWGLWLRIWSQSSKIHVSKMAGTKWRTFFLAKIFLFDHFCVNMRTRGFLGSLTNLKSKFENLIFVFWPNHTSNLQIICKWIIYFF